MAADGAGDPGQVLSLRNAEFIEAARATGVRPIGILVRHIVPNVTGVAIVYMTLIIPEVILVESFLGYLGLGVQEPDTSLGVLISEGANAIEQKPWMTYGPGIFLVVLLMALNFLGDGLRDAFDPRIVEEAARMTARTPGTDQPILSMRDLVIAFDTPDGVVEAVNGISLDLYPGEVLGIVGESGSGKSQSWMATLGLLADNASTQGEVVFDGHNLLDLDTRSSTPFAGGGSPWCFRTP